MATGSGKQLLTAEQRLRPVTLPPHCPAPQGSAKRRTAETLLNKQSSRSHSVFVVTVSVREVTPEGDELIRVGKVQRGGGHRAGGAASARRWPAPDSVACPPIGRAALPGGPGWL